jgi:hypothetical protein
MIGGHAQERISIHHPLSLTSCPCPHLSPNRVKPTLRETVAWNTSRGILCPRVHCWKVKNRRSETATRHALSIPSVVAARLCKCLIIDQWCEWNRALHLLAAPCNLRRLDSRQDCTKGASHFLAGSACRPNLDDTGTAQWIGGPPCRRRQPSLQRSSSAKCAGSAFEVHLFLDKRRRSV